MRIRPETTTVNFTVTFNEAVTGSDGGELRDRRNGVDGGDGRDADRKRDDVDGAGDGGNGDRARSVSIWSTRPG
jgi:hypothetical protein